MKKPISSFILHLSSFVLLIALGNTASAQWIIDGQKLLIATDPQAARNFGTNTVYHITDAVARWVALPNGLALEVWSENQQQWLRQAEYTED